MSEPDAVTMQIGALLRGETIDDGEAGAGEETAQGAGEGYDPSKEADSGASHGDEGDAQGDGVDEVPATDAATDSDAGGDTQDARKGDEPGADDDGGGYSLDNLAQELGVKAADLYDVDIPFGGEGQTMTLGEIKDLAREVQDVVAEREEVATARRNNERDLIAARQELETMLSGIDQRMLTPAMVQQARNSLATTIRTENEKLVEALPGWADPEVRKAGMEDIRKIAKKCGFTDAEVDTTYDARLLLMIKQYGQMEARLAAADRNAKESQQRHVPQRSTGAKPAMPSKSARLAKRIAAAKASRSTDAKVGVVGEILRGQ